MISQRRIEEELKINELGYKINIYIYIYIYNIQI